MTMALEDVRASEIRTALGNALKLGTSLLCTWGLALCMRFWLPRQLGPDRYGVVSFADAFAATCLVALGLGIDPYVRKEVPVRPAHASDFMGGVVVLRGVMSLALVAVISWFMTATGRPAEVRRLVYVFTLAQLLVTNNATLSALLHARGTVGGMSILAVVTKIVWALGVILAVSGTVGLSGIAFALLASEAIEFVVLFVLARQNLGLVFRVDARATRAVLILCLPHFVNMFAITIYGKLDLTLLAMGAPSREVGYYAAASAVAGCALLATPLMGWVMMPTLARAAARSRNDLFAGIRRSAELVLAVAIPAALFVGLAADVAVDILFGRAFAPAVPALRLLAMTFVVTYTATVFAISLILLDKAWTLAFVSLGGLVVNVLLNLAIVPRALAVAGEGGGGVGCALAMLGTDLTVTSAMLWFVGRSAFDRRGVLTVVKSLAACAVVLAADRVASGLPAAVRLGLDGCIYVSFAVATGVVRLEEVVALARKIAGERVPKLATPPKRSAELR
jgi:O-antigen/teichoic acid export membrane protein